MAGKGDEDFWNTRSIPSFNFDDDEEIAPEVLSNETTVTNNSIFSSSVDETDNPLPIHSIISKRNLDLILADVQLPTYSHIPPVEETITKAFLGKPCNLHHYKTLENKIELLDQALQTYDGNVILMVILFLSKTLKMNIFLRILAKRKMVLKHYDYYLSQSNMYHQLGDLYMATGNSSYVIDLFYLSCRNTMNKGYVLSKLEQFMVEHSSHIPLERDKQIFNDYIKFLKWQLKTDISCESVTEALSLFTRLNWQKNKDDNKIIEFKSDMKIGDFQFEWILLNTYATLQMWKKLTDYFIRPNWLTKKSSFKSVIDLDLILSTLHKHNAPKKVLEDFLTCMVDFDKSLTLGKKMLCHRFVLDQLINQKDRLSLIKYKSLLSPNSEDFFYAENTLRSNDKKWKN